ncbi:hypothetical protein [Pseudoruegeria sp. SK021]|uniref:hypothetical protein n=1 Tax=Pseudoruegeria sp. SK021 TaxID=1933035 RepID=UPI00352C0CE2
MCGAMHTDTSRLHVDHIAPHDGDACLFWETSNLWTVCASCHDGECQRIEAAHEGYPEAIRAAKMAARRQA